MKEQVVKPFASLKLRSSEEREPKRSPHGVGGREGDQAAAPMIEAFKSTIEKSAPAPLPRACLETLRRTAAALEVAEELRVVGKGEGGRGDEKRRGEHRHPPSR